MMYILYFTSVSYPPPNLVRGHILFLVFLLCSLTCVRGFVIPSHSSSTFRYFLLCSPIIIRAGNLPLGMLLTFVLASRLYHVPIWSKWVQYNSSYILIYFDSSYINTSACFATIWTDPSCFTGLATPYRVSPAYFGLGTIILIEIRNLNPTVVIQCSKRLPNTPVP